MTRTADKSAIAGNETAGNEGSHTAPGYIGLHLHDI